jgi:hypothetical protein
MWVNLVSLVSVDGDDVVGGDNQIPAGNDTKRFQLPLKPLDSGVFGVM